MPAGSGPLPALLRIHPSKERTSIEKHKTEANAGASLRRPHTGLQPAGLQPRDIILQFEDREISSFTDLSAALAKQKAGDTVTLKIYRAGAELEITLTLDERPGESEIDATEQQAQAELEGQTDTDTDIPDFGGFEGYGYDYDMD